MAQEKTKRNKMILKLLKEGRTYTEVMEIFGLKSKGNVYQIVKRYKDKNSVLSYPQGKSLQRT